MKKNKLILKIEQLGFTVRERNINNEIILQCLSNENLISFGVHIKNDVFEIWNASQQKSTPKNFNNENELIEYIKEFFSIE
jgi:hypothetical protein